MIKKISDVLSKDFILVMSKIKLDELGGKPVQPELLEILAKLAELNQPNALAYYYQYFSPGENKLVDSILLNPKNEDVIMDFALCNYRYAMANKELWNESVEKIKVAFRKLGENYNDSHNFQLMDSDCDSDAFEEYIDIIANEFEVQPFYDEYKQTLRRACDIAYDTDDMLNEAEYYEMTDRVFKVLPYESLFDMWDLIDIIKDNRRELAYLLLDKYIKKGSLVYGYSSAVMMLDPANEPNDFYTAYGEKILKDISNQNTFSEKVTKYELKGVKSSSAPQ